MYRWMNNDSKFIYFTFSSALIRHDFFLFAISISYSDVINNAQCAVDGWMDEWEWDGRDDMMRRI